MQEVQECDTYNDNPTITTYQDISRHEIVMQDLRFMDAG
jgi:hypothetical protein